MLLGEQNVKSSLNFSVQVLVLLQQPAERVTEMTAR